MLKEEKLTPQSTRDLLLPQLTSLREGLERDMKDLWYLEERQRSGNLANVIRLTELKFALDMLKRTERSLWRV